MPNCASASYPLQVKNSKAIYQNNRTPGQESGELALMRFLNPADCYARQPTCGMLLSASTHTIGLTPLQLYPGSYGRQEVRVPRQNSKTDDLKSYCIQVSQHTNSAPHVVSHLITEAHRAGITGLDFCDTTHLFFLRGSLTLEDVEHSSCELMVDPVTQAVCITEADSRAASPQPIDHTIEVMLLPGVTDSVAEN